MMRGGIINSGWNSTEALHALELCLGCKACKKDCPVHVDIDQYKAEFLYHFYKNRSRPRIAYIMGFIGSLAPLAAQATKVANFLSQTPVVRLFSKWAGEIAPARAVPVFADESFKEWYRRHDPGQREHRKNVVLFADVFNNFFYPHTLQAAYLVLRNWGYNVIVPAGRIPAPRPLLHYGFIDEAKKDIQQVVDQVRTHIRQGSAVVFCEPSTASVYRDEAPSLFPNDTDVQLMSQNALLLSEFIEREKLPLPGMKGKVLFHAHCHQRAVLNPDAARQILRKMGLEYDEPQKTCCGMAGSFGYENDKYELSMKIGELALFPAVRALPPDAYIVADGFSCRTQIKDGTGRSALHMAELLLLALRDAAQHNREAVSPEVQEILAQV
jgi:Fe-S oxidoreductase